MLCLAGICIFLIGSFIAACDKPAATADRHCNPNGTCTACKSCTHCGHCARAHGTCSVCRPKPTITKATP